MKYAVEVKETKNGRGRGCFALKKFRKGEIIEPCPTILLTIKECKLCEKTFLDNYIYAWNKKYGAILLGYGFIYNHSYEPNAEYIRDYKNKLMIYKAIKSIKPGEEILVNYNGEPKSKAKIDWFKVV